MGKYPQENTKNKASQNEIHAGGPATNAAITCAYLGSNVDLLTPIGTHTLSFFLKNDLKKAGVNLLDPLTNMQGSPVFSSIITSTENASRTVFYYNPEITITLGRNNYPDLELYKLVMFDGFYPEIAIPLAQKCKSAGITTILDAGSWKEHTEELLNFVSIAICSDDFHVPASIKSRDVFTFLHSRGVSSIAITRGDKAILYSCKGSTAEIPVDTINVVDTLGAGDVFHGAFCNYYFKDQNFVESLYRAAQVAGESCKTFGTRGWMSKTDKNLCD
jgi:sugar/nucleoside kinase (ribokinase family)